MLLSCALQCHFGIAGDTPTPTPTPGQYTLRPVPVTAAPCHPPFCSDGGGSIAPCATLQESGSSRSRLGGAIAAVLRGAAQQVVRWPGVVAPLPGLTAHLMFGSCRGGGNQNLRCQCCSSRRGGGGGGATPTCRGPGRTSSEGVRKSRRRALGFRSDRASEE